MKISPRLWILVGALVALVVLVLGIFFIVLPQQRKVGDIDNEIKSVEDQIRMEEARAIQLKKYREDPEQFTRQIEALKEKMPENMDLADVIQQIDSAAEKAGLDFFSFTPELPINVGNFYVTTIETKFYGRYFHLVEFFNHIERLPRSVKPITLSIKGGDDNLPYLDITIKFRVFFTTDKEVEKLVKSPTATGGGTAPPTPQAGK